ncbi:MAG: hypothetical protein ACI89X_003058 [Planctomycetota bacterium]|jgi:uncharacterized protein (DUF1330 family)
MSEAIRHETLVGLHVTDHNSYAQYRAVMTPLLEAVGGFFRYDFTIDAMLQGDSDPAINRLFLISFPDAATETAFFADPAYVAARNEFFESAVGMVNILGTLVAPAR